jgi:hypothetical protein
MSQVIDTIDLTTLVNQYAEVHAELNALQAESDELKARLIASGETKIPGTFVKAVITTSKPRVTTDWKGVASELHAPQTIIDAFTKTGEPAVSVRLYAL